MFYRFINCNKIYIIDPRNFVDKYVYVPEYIDDIDKNATDDYKQKLSFRLRPDIGGFVYNRAIGLDYIIERRTRDDKVLVCCFFCLL
jgi:hypothetical protein